MLQLSGDLSLMNMFDGELSLINMLDGDLNITTELDGELGIYQKVIEVDPYTGEYVADPKFYAQTLATAEKYMADDVTVNAIEVARTTNPAGGKTVYIGGIING